LEEVISCFEVASSVIEVGVESVFNLAKVFELVCIVVVEFVGEV